MENSGISLIPKPLPPELCPMKGVKYKGFFKNTAARKQPYKFDNDFYSRSKEFLPADVTPFDYAPVQLTDTRLNKAFAKYNVIAPTLDPIALTRAKNYLLTKLKSAGIKNTKVRPYITGVLNTNHNAGPGAPYKFLNRDRKDLLNSAEFKQRVDAQWKRWVNNEAVVSVSSGIGKYELRDVERVQAGKARQFSDVSFETLLNGYRLTSDLSDKLFQASKEGKVPIFGGEDVLISWKNLYKRLKDYDIFWDTDFSGWDSRLWTVLLQTVYSIRYELLSPEFQTQENKNALVSLCREICESYVALDTGFVFQKFNGNLSGQPATFVDNSLANLLSFYYIAFLEFGHDAAEILTKLDPYVCGDDVIVGARKEMRPYLEQLSAKYDYHLNFKPDTNEVRDDLTKANFVSANFIEDNGYVYQLRDPNKILSSLFYYDTANTFPYRLMKIDGLKPFLMPYPSLLLALDKIKTREIELFSKKHSADPQYLLYHSPDFLEMRERCKLN